MSRQIQNTNKYELVRFTDVIAYSESAHLEIL